jgi:hypothetical protein
MGRFAAIALLVLAVSCTGQPIAHQPTPSRPEAARSASVQVSVTEAIKLALAEPTLILPAGSFPDRPGRQSCTIIGGGPYPGLHIAGACQTSASADASGGWLIRFTQYWDAHLFRYSGEPATGELSYQVTYDVHGDTKVVFRDASGSFPPQEAF